MFRALRELQAVVADYTVGTVIVIVRLAIKPRPARLPSQAE